jgi:hypothetical protein
MTISLRVLPRFPARISGSNGIKVIRTAGSPDLVIVPDYGAMTQVPAVINPDDAFFLVWQEDQDMYVRMSFNDVFAAMPDLGLLRTANNLSELTATAATARANIGLTIGTNVQAFDASLLSIAGLTTAANKMIYTTALDTYAVTDLSAFARTLLDDADAATARATLGLGSMSTASLALIKSLANGRLTFESGVPISTTDQLAKTSVFWTPFRGNDIALYVGGAWIIREFVETALSLSGFTTGKPYDIFAYDNAGTLALEALIWTNDTTRATAIAFQDGVPVKSGDATRRLLGTIYTSATGQSQMKFGSAAAGGDPAFIGIDNVYNRVPASVFVADTTASWTQVAGGPAALNASNNNRASFIRSMPGDRVEAHLLVMAASGSGGGASVGFGLDSTSAFTPRAVIPRGATNAGANLNVMVGSEFSGFPGVGFHFLHALQAAAVATATFTGSSNAAGFTAELDY